MAEKKFQQVCTCTNCGNEAEMTVTCSLQPEAEKNSQTPKVVPKAEGEHSGHATCSRCGNESEIWLKY